MTGIKLVCPIQPYELDKKMRLGLKGIVSRVVMQAAVRSFGNDVFLQVYMTGLYHGVELGRRLGKEDPQ